MQQKILLNIQVPTSTSLDLEYIQDIANCLSEGQKERISSIGARYLYNMYQTMLSTLQNRFRNRIGSSGKYHERYTRTIFERPLARS